MAIVPALPDTERRTTYNVTAETGPFDVGFAVYGNGTDYAAWLEVWLNGTPLTPITDWTAALSSGTFATVERPMTNVQVTLTAAQSGTLEIVGMDRPRRTVQVQEGQGVTARDFNQAITHGVARLRETWDRTGRIEDNITTLTDLLGFGVPSEFPVLPSRAAALIATEWDNVTTFLTLGYYQADGEGASFYTRTLTEPTGTTGPAKFQLTDGSWAKLIGLNNRIDVLMFGAKRDGVPAFNGLGEFTGVTGTFCNTSFEAMGTFIGENTQYRHVVIPGGNYASYAEADWGFLPGPVPPARSGNIDPMLDLTGAAGNALTLDMRGAKIYIDTPNYDNPTWIDNTYANFGAVIRFTDCTDVTVLGGEIIGDLTLILVNTTGSPVGFVGVYVRGKCDRMRVLGTGATGILQPCGNETYIGTAFELDDSDTVLIEAGGAGYAVNDTVRFAVAAIGGSTHGVLTVGSVSAGAVTGLVITDPGRFEYDPNTAANAAPTIDRTEIGFPTVTLTGGGSGLLIRPFLRVVDPFNTLPIGMLFDCWAELCMRCFTSAGAGAIGTKLFAKANNIQRAITVANENRNMEVDLIVGNSWLNVCEFVSYQCTPDNWTCRIDHEANEGVNTTGWINNSGTIIHDAQMAYPARFYNTKAFVKKRWPSKYTANGQQVWCAFATAEGMGDLQHRRHRVWGFELYVSLEDAPGNNGLLLTPHVIGLGNPGVGWQPYEAWDIRGMKVAGSMGGQAVCDLPIAAFPVDPPDYSGLAALNANQIMIDGVPAGDTGLVDVQVFIASGTWIKPTAAANAIVDVYVVGPGGGGASGARRSAGTASSGGGAGGGGGQSYRRYRCSELSATETVTIPATGGVGGAAVTADNTNGNNGTSVANASFAGGTSRGVVGGAGAAGTGGQSGGAAAGGGGGFGTINGVAGGSGASGAIGGSGTTSLLGGCTGGGAGAGMAAAAANQNGGTSGIMGIYSSLAAAGGIGASKTAAALGSTRSTTAMIPKVGCGGGGGWCNADGTAGGGAAGGEYGGGGAGGGSSVNGNASGAGGNGGPAICIVITLRP